MTFRRFEDIDAWKTARQLAKAIYRMSASGSFRRDFGLRDQIRRATISMMANIAEGHSRRSDREFAQFLFTAKGSAAEVESHLYIALDQDYLTEEQFQEAFAESERYARQVSGLIKYLTDGDHTQAAGQIKRGPGRGSLIR